MPEMNKEKWIDGIMDSAEGMQQAAPDNALFSKIQDRLGDRGAYVLTVPLRTVSLTAASIVLLVAMNLFLLVEDRESDRNTEQSVEAVIDYYGFNSETVLR